MWSIFGNFPLHIYIHIYNVLVWLYISMGAELYVFIGSINLLMDR